VVQTYIIVLSFYLVKNAFTGGTLDFSMDQGVGHFLQSFFSSSGAGIVLIALVSTYGIYFLASFMYMDPWHMFTSSWAYFAGMTCSINILMVYAFCNWHDVSWGTKGSDKGDSLPVVETKKDDGKSNFIEEVDKPQADIDSQFESTVKRALEPYVVPEEKEERSNDDGYKAFRTNLVLIWIFSNLILTLCITSEGINRFCLTVCLLQSKLSLYLIHTQNTSTVRTSKYFAAILWTTAGLSIFRFIGSIWFLGKSGILCCVSRR
jgi:chitin synthase